MGYLYSYKIDNDLFLITKEINKKEWNDFIWQKFNKVIDFRIIKNNIIKEALVK